MNKVTLLQTKFSTEKPRSIIAERMYQLNSHYGIETVRNVFQKQGIHSEISRHLNTLTCMYGLSLVKEIGQVIYKQSSKVG